MAKKYKDTSPLAMGRKQKGSAANKKKKKDDVKTGAKAVTNVAGRSLQSSASTKQPANQASTGTYRRNTSSGSKGPQQSTEQNTNTERQTIQRRTNRNRPIQTAEQMQQQREAAAKQSYNKAREDRFYAQQKKDLKDRYSSNLSREDRQAQKSGIETESLKAKQKENEERMNKTAAGRIVYNAPERWAENEEKYFTNIGIALSDAGEMLNGTDRNKNGRLAQDMGDLLPDSKQLKKQYGQATKDYMAKRDELEAKAEERNKNAGRLEKNFYSAEESGQGMLTDYIVGMATGPVGGWAVPLALRSYGGERGKAEELGATTTEDRLNAAKDAAIEVATERIGGFFGKGGGKFAKAAEGAGRDVKSAFRRFLKTGLEEWGEELIANPSEHIGENLIYRNRLQKEREAQNDQYFADIAADIQANFADNPTEVQRYIAEINSAETRQEFIDDFKEGGMTDEQASAVADKMIEFMVAAAQNDPAKMKAIKDSLDEDLVGDARMKWWDWNEQLDVALSTWMVSGVGGAGGAINSYQQGQAIKSMPNANQRMMNALEKIAAFDPKNSSKSQAMLDAMKNEGYEPTATQAYDIMVDEREVMAKTRDNQIAANQLKEREVKAEGITVPVATYDENGDYRIEGKVSAERYAQRYTDTLEFIQAVDDSTYNEKTNRNDAMAVAETVASYEVGTLNIAETANLSVDHPENRYVFQEMTGIDLSQYNVYKNGKLDAAASNMNMQEKLLARSSQNYIESARLEQFNWNDEERGRLADAAGKNLNPQGDLALHDALNSVDPRDYSKFMLMGQVAQDVYSRSYYTQDSWEDVKKTYQKLYPSLDIGVLEGMYESAKTDRAEAETPYLNEKVEAGKPMGKTKTGSRKGQVRGRFINETPFNEETGEGRDLTNNEAAAIKQMAKDFNKDIIQIDAEDERLRVTYQDENGETRYDTSEEGEYKRANAKVDFRNNVIYISNAAPVEKILHEIVHETARLAAPQYIDMAHYILDAAYKYDAEETQAMLDHYHQLYAGQGLTDAQIEEEVVADLVAKYMHDPKFVRAIANENLTALQKIKNAIDDIIRAIRNFISTGYFADENQRNSLLNTLGIYTDVRNMMVRVYDEARSAQATEAINETQDQINELSEIRHSLGEDYTIKDGKARWTDDRIDYIIRDNREKFTNKTYAWATNINPRDFLKLTLDDKYLEMWNESANNVPDEVKGMSYREADEYVYQKYKETGTWIHDNENYPLDTEELRAERTAPFLRVLQLNGKTRVDGHEGRHRMRALMEAGVESVPVLITTNSLTVKEPIRNLEINAQDYAPHGPVNNDAKIKLQDLVPVIEDNRDELIQKFGGEAQVRFSISEQQDKDYMDTAKEYQKLYEADDPGWLKLQPKLYKMVDEAAIANGYNIKAYHGTDSEPFNVFDRDKLRHGRQYGDGFYFSPYEEVAGEYGQDVREYYLKGNGQELGEFYAAQDYRDFDTVEEAEKFFDEKYKQFVQNGQGIERFRPEARRVDGKYRVIYTTIGSFQNDVILVATEPEYIKSAEPITYDDEGNIIPLRERFNEDVQDIRFSLNEPVERVKDLIAVHNLKPTDISNAFKLGGFPMPSIAVTKDSMGHELYGDITLMFHSDTIDPKASRYNQVFGGDAWTPTFPAVKKLYSRKKADEIASKLKDILGIKNEYKDLPKGIRFPDFDQENLSNKLDYTTPGEAYTHGSGSEVMKLAYLKNAKNFDVAIPMKEGSIRNLDRQALEHLDDKLPELSYDDIFDTVQRTMEYEPAVREARKAYYESKGNKIFKALSKTLYEEMGYSEVHSRLEALIKYRNEGMPEVIDQSKFDKILSDNIDIEEYKQWVDDLYEGIVEKEGVRNNKDLFLPSGNRRSWESLHDPVTLDNVVSIMRKELAAGSNGLFGANPKGAAQKSYKSLDEIRADEDRLQMLPEDEYEALGEAATQKLVEVCQDIVAANPKHFDNRFGAVLDTGEYIAEILNKTRNKAEIKRRLKTDYWLDVSDEQMDSLMEAIEAIANVPTGYFEAKPRRAVGFNEVKAAIIPSELKWTDGLYDEIRSELELMEIPIYEYDYSKEGDRQRVVNEAATEQDLRFSISEDSNGRSLTESQQMFFNNSKVLDDEGRLKVMYHGTPNIGFTVFDYSKAKPGTLGRGFYFTDSPTHASNHGQSIEVYLNIANPLTSGTNNITKDQLRAFVERLAEDEDYGIENYGYGSTVDSVTESVWGGTDFQMMHDLNLSCVGDLAEACRIFNEVNGTDYDGIITPVETLAMRPEQIKFTDNLDPTSDTDMRYSLDDEYMAAVESGDMETAQKLVETAAKEAGYRENVFHGTYDFGTTKFNDEYGLFTTNKVGTARQFAGGGNLRSISGELDFDKASSKQLIRHINSNSGFDIERIANEHDFEYEIDRMTYSEEDIKKYNLPKDWVERNERNLEVLRNMYDRMKNGETFFYSPFNGPGKSYGPNSAISTRDEAIDVAKKYIGGVSGRGVYALALRPEKRITIKGNGQYYTNIKIPNSLKEYATAEEKERGLATTDQLMRMAFEAGYLTVEFEDIVEGGDYGNAGHSDVIVSLKPSRNVKSLDTVTYAEDGSVIPLSERFDPTTDDIRYSLPTQDTEGRILSDGQLEYFKNSQARGEGGKLVPVYHTTNRGGFTIFDPSYSDDKRSLFFADDWDTSQTYGNYANSRFYYFDIDNIDDVKKYLDAYSPDRYFVTQEQFDQAGGWEADMLDFENVTNGEQSDFAKYLDNPDGYIAIIGVPDYSPDNTSYADAWVMAKSPDELVRELHNHFGWQRDNYRMGTQHGYYACYLNLEDPYIIDAHGDNWNEIHLDDYDDDVTFNTREIAEMAMDMDFDGVIIRNLVDHGGKSPYDGMFDYSDIYIAFSSNQVKDINNENPTENPDIRYSIVDDDEAMSYAAHDDAYDDSWEAMEYYESVLSSMVDIDLDDGFINHPMQVFLENLKKYGETDAKARRGRNKYKYRETKYNSEEDWTEAFYEGLTWQANEMRFDDPVLEEGRTRMANSRNDFFNSTVAKWNQGWVTEGSVLDINSIKKPVRDLVAATMQGSDTDRKYNSDTVKKTLIDMRLAYWYAQQGRIEIADALLWHTAHRMIENVEFYADDSVFNEYKDLRQYLRTTRIQLGEEYWADVDYQAFRKANFGRLKLVKGQTNVDQIYAELEELFPGLFNSEEYTTPPDQLMHMAAVLDSIQPYKEAYSSEECAALATEIASDLLDIMQNEGKAIESVADKYEAKIQAMRTRHAEAMLKVREQRDRGIKAEKAKFKEYVAKQKEKTLHKKHYQSIQKNYKKLTERLLTNTADKNIPEQYKKELAKLLGAFDLQTVGSKKYEARTGRKSQKTIRMGAMIAALSNIESKSGEFHVNDAITDIMDELLGKDTGSGHNRSIEGLTIDELNSSELARIDNLLQALLHEFNTYKTVKVKAKRQQVEDIGKAQVDSALKHAEEIGPGKDYNSALGILDKIVNLDEMTASYLFRRIDPNNEGLGLMYKELRRSFDHYVRNTAQLNEWMEKILGEYQNRGKGPRKYGADQIAQWRSFHYTQTFNFEKGPVRLTPAQMMSIYCLSKRPQAYNHMTGAGIVAAPNRYDANLVSDIKQKANTALPVKMTDADIKQVVDALTPDQRKVAEDLQQLMANQMAAWGNEASMNVLGIELFNEPDYFPIKSDKAALISDLSEDQFAEAIRSFGFTKAVQPGAKNAIMVDDIFTVVAEHCNNMNLYNSYSEAINDFMKVYNYRDVDDSRGEYTVKQAIAYAYSQKATAFIGRFIKDLNGNVSGNDTGISKMYNDLLSKAKKASVFANGRVALQQPTAIARAFYVINPIYLKGIVTNEKAVEGAMKEMFEHCPIALWKSWGYYDIQMGRTVEDVMMNNGNWIEDVETGLYGVLDNVTWTAIWQMVKAEMKDTHPDVEIGTDEYWELCNERMSEVVDLTQVVDSPMHRSHAMRSKNYLEKTATAFMSEPTLTFNMVKDGLVQAKEALQKGDKAKAGSIFAKTMGVFFLQAALVSGMAAIWDAVRGKNPSGDDDDDESRFKLWWLNTLNNFKDELAIWNKVYFVKDISSLFEGFGVNNMALQGWKSIADGFAQLTGSRNVYSSKKWYENFLTGAGYVTGKPFGTLFKDLKAIYNMLGLDWKAFSSISDYLDETQEKFSASWQAIFGKKDEDSMAASFLAVFDGKKNGTEEQQAEDTETEEESDSSVPSKEDLPDNLTDEQKEEIIKSAEKRSKKAEEKQEGFNKDDALYKALKSASGLEGEEYNKKVYSVVANGLKGYIEDGDYETIAKMKDVIEEAGGDVSYFEQRVLDETKSAYKKGLGYDLSKEERWDMKAQWRYMIGHGMTAEEISSEILYKSDMARDLKVAYRIGDNNTIYEAMLPLVDAGITEADISKLYDNRNKMDIKKYDGRYKDKLKSTGTFVWPTEGTITSGYGYRGDDPTLPAGASKYHEGIDIGAALGTPVVACDGGVVISAGKKGGYGNSVGIKHDDGTISYYNHLYNWNVQVGDTVGQGQQIGQVGSTGTSSGAHLDFRVYKNGDYLNPMDYLNKRS